MRPSAPELAARYRDGMVAEEPLCWTRGMIATEMLYFLVGSRDLDGGLMCTASHNPKAYTGAKLVERGAIALSGRPGPPGHPAHDRGGPGRPTGRRLGGGGRHRRGVPGRGAARSSTRPRSSRAGWWSTAATGWPAQMVGPLLQRLGIDLVRPTVAERRLPRPRAQPAARGEPPRHRGEREGRGRRAGDRLDGDADRCFFIDDGGRFVDGDFLTTLLADSIRASSRARRSSTTCARRAPCRTR